MELPLLGTQRATPNLFVWTATGRVDVPEKVQRGCRSPSEQGEKPKLRHCNYRLGSIASPSSPTTIAHSSMPVRRETHRHLISPPGLKPLTWRPEAHLLQQIVEALPIPLDLNERSINRCGRTCHWIIGTTNPMDVAHAWPSAVLVTASRFQAPVTSILPEVGRSMVPIIVMHGCVLAGIRRADNGRPISPCLTVSCPLPTL